MVEIMDHLCYNWDCRRGRRTEVPGKFRENSEESNKERRTGG